MIPGYIYRLIYLNTFRLDMSHNSILLGISTIPPSSNLRTSHCFAGLKTPNCKLPFMDEESKVQRKEETVPCMAVMAVSGFTPKHVTWGPLLYPTLPSHRCIKHLSGPPALPPRGLSPSWDDIQNCTQSFKGKMLGINSTFTNREADSGPATDENDVYRVVNKKGKLLSHKMEKNKNSAQKLYS